MWSDWLAITVGISGIVAVVILGIFVAGTRLFPTTRPPSDVYSGETKRRTEIREFLSAIDERFAEEHFVEGQHVAFYLPERDVAVTFDARAYFRIDRSSTHPVLVEHEMPGVQLGDRLPFETPEMTGHRVDTTRAAFAVLGLPPTASRSEVKAAYREKVKAVHPDLGGDESAFRRVREAYTTASNEAS